MNNIQNESRLVERVRSTLATREGLRGPSLLDQLIGVSIKSIRLDNNISQKDLADALNLTFQQIQKYEAGTNRISASMLLCLSLILDQPVSVFLRTAREYLEH